MLIRFEVANFRSILDTVELSLVAVDADRTAVRSVPGIGESLVPLAAVYGPNASGKSNILAALDWLRSAVADSLRYWEDGIPIEAFALADTGSRTTDFVVEFVIDGVRFEYVVELDRNRIHHEALFHYPKRARRRIFERDGDDLKLQRGLGVVSGVRELLTERTLVLSAARRFDERFVARFAYALFSMQFLGMARPLLRLSPLGNRSTASFFDLDESTAPPVVNLAESAAWVDPDRAKALAMLRMADFGVEDVEIVEDEVASELRSYSGRRIRLLHSSAGGVRPLEMDAESDGTRTWFDVIGPTLHALQRGLPVIFDELDGSLHPLLSAQLLRLFRDPETNPLGAQLIFSTHDTSLLDHLARDEVWLTEKGGTGATSLTPLADFSSDRVRRSVELEQGYLNGRFGGLPDVDRTEMLRALGLVG